MTNDDLNNAKLSELVRWMIIDGTTFDSMVKSEPTKYAWDMSHWHYYEDDRLCGCFAGAIEHLEDLDPDYSDTWRYRVDEIRKGNLHNAQIRRYEHAELDEIEDWFRAQPRAVGDNPDVAVAIDTLKELAQRLCAAGF